MAGKAKAKAIEETAEAAAVPEGFTLADALESVLITNAAEKADWRTLVKEGATDQQIRRRLTFFYPKDRVSSRMGVCQISTQPVLAFWFGSYGKGPATLTSQDLVDKVREVLGIPWPKEEVVEESKSIAEEPATDPNDWEANQEPAASEITNVHETGVTLIEKSFLDDGLSAADQSRTMRSPLVMDVDTDFTDLLPGQSDSSLDALVEILTQQLSEWNVVADQERIKVRLDAVIAEIALRAAELNSSTTVETAAAEEPVLDHAARRLEEFKLDLQNQNESEVIALKLRLADELSEATKVSVQDEIRERYAIVVAELQRREDEWLEAKVAEGAIDADVAEQLQSGSEVEVGKGDEDHLIAEFAASLVDRSDSELSALRLELSEKDASETSRGTLFLDAQFEAVETEIERRRPEERTELHLQVSEDFHAALERGRQNEQAIFDDSASPLVVIGRDRLVMTVEEAIVAEQLTFQFDFSDLNEDDAHAIKKRTIEIRDRVARGAELTAEIGEALRDVKRRLDRGRFDEYLKREFGMSRDTADRFIGVKELADQSPQFAENRGKLPKSVQYLLIAPSTPEEAKQEILDRAEGGEQVTRSAAKEIVSKHKPEVEPQAEPAVGELVIEGRSLKDLLTMLRDNPMQVEELVSMGFKPNVIEQAVQERLIDKTIKGKCTYLWTVADVVDFVTKQGSVSRGQLDRAGCNIGAILEAEREGAIVRVNGCWEIPTDGGRKAGPDKTEQRETAKAETSGSVKAQYPGGNVAPQAPITELLKGRKLTVTFMFGILPDKCVAGIRVGDDPLATSNVTIEATKVRGFPDAVNDLIAKQLAAAVKASPVKAPTTPTPAPPPRQTASKASKRKAAPKKAAVKKAAKPASSKPSKKKPAAKKKGAKR